MRFNKLRSSESEEQIAFFQYINIRANQDVRFRNIFAIPNGGSRNKAEAVNLKRQGVLAGVPDIACMIPNSKYHGLFIEMKVGSNKPTSKQYDVMQNLTDNGYKCVVCYSSVEAIRELENYINI